MVARITTGKDIIGLLNYNEMKVTEGTAKLLDGNSIIGDLDDITSVTFKQKVESFQRNLSLNTRIEKPTFHVSLNPNPHDKLTDDQLIEMGRQYMSDMGYGSQPYLVYKHEDIDRHHIHIVSIRVDEDGKKIDANFEKKRSLTAIQKLEEDYNLIKVSEKIKQNQELYPLAAIQYGKDATRQSISNIVKQVASEYQFQSLVEYNSILREFNVTADHLQGEYKQGVKQDTYEGLIYSALNEKGQRVGVPTKSSQISKSVGLKALQDKFKLSPSIIERAFLKQKVSQKVDSLLRIYSSITQDDFAEKLRTKGITVLYRQNEQGRLYGVTFVDHQNKVVFNGSQLGKPYAANQLAQQFGAVTITKDAERALQKSLQHYYSHIRKTDPRYFFESDLIKDLPGKYFVLTDHLQQTSNNIPLGIIKEAIEKFVLAKSGTLSEVLTKEIGYFEKNTRSIIDLINNNIDLSFADRLRFLRANQVSLVKSGNLLKAVHVKNRAIGFDFSKQEVNNFFPTQPQEATVSFRASDIPAYTNTEAKFIRALATSTEDLSIFQPWNVRTKLISPYLSEQDNIKIYNKLNQNYLASILPQINGLPSKQVAANLLQRGIIIYPTADAQGKIETYRLNFFEYPLSGSVKASPELSRILSESGYTFQTAQKASSLFLRQTLEESKPTIQYRALVQLSQAMDRNDFNQTKNTLRIIENINKNFTFDIRRAIQKDIKLLDSTQGSDKQKIEKEITQKISYLIAVYPNRSLKPDPNYVPSHIEPAGGQKSFFNIADSLFSAIWNNEPSSKLEDHKQDKKRKQRRRPKL